MNIITAFSFFLLYSMDLRILKVVNLQGTVSIRAFVLSIP